MKFLRLSVWFGVALVCLCAARADIVINEIMYNPASHDAREEYIELFNTGSTNVNLSGWTISGGVDFAIPTNTTLTAGSYLVVAAHRPTFINRFPGVNNVVGSWLTQSVMNVNGRSLTNSTPILSNNRNTINLNNALGDRVDSVTYADAGDWAIRRRGLVDSGRRGWIWYAEHDGMGASLELRNPALPNQYGQNWSPSPIGNPTPGQANVSAVNNIPPLVVEVRHAPTIPRSSDPVSITARVFDEAISGVTVTLQYRIDSANPPPFTPVQMFDDGAHGDASDGDGIYGVVLPAMPNNTLVEFYVEATDGQGNTRAWPGPTLPAVDQGSTPATQEANAMFQVDDQAYSGTPPTYKLIMTTAQYTELATLFNNAPNSDAQVNATFISIDSTGIERRYLCGTRNRGHGSRSGTPHNYRVNFPSDTPWKGVDGYNINARGVPAQVLGAAVALRAGAAGHRARFVQLRVNNGGGPGGTPANGLYAGNEDVDGEWAERQFPNNSEGNIYAVVRDIRPPNFDYRGEDAVAYQNTYFKQNNVGEDDWQDLIGMLFVMGENQTNSFTMEAARQVADIDQWLVHLAVMNLFGNNESGVNTGNNDDYYWYRGDKDPRFVFVYHDLDSVLGMGSLSANDGNIFRSTCCPISGDTEGIWRAMNFFLHHPEVEPLYYRTIQDLLDTTFSQPQFDAIVDAVFGDIPALANAAANAKTWMNTKRMTVQNVISGFVPPRAETPVATISGEPRSPTWRNSATLTVGGAGISHYQWRLNFGPWNPQTPVSTPITLSSLPNGSTNTVYVIGRLTNGVWQTVPTVSRTWVVNTATPTVRLNEVLARNISAVSHGGAFPDVLELYNEGSSAVSLSGLRLTDDPSNPNKFVFSSGASLAAGAYLVLYATDLGFSFEANGEGAFLFASSGNTVLDSVMFGPQLPDLSIGRVGASGTWSLTQPTFGAANVIQALGSSSTVKINEWKAIGNASAPDDFIELYNSASLPVNLGGHYLTDNPLGFAAKHRIHDLTFIAPGGFLVLIADNDETRPDHVGFALEAEQGEIALFSPALVAIDAITYGPQRLEISSGRCPDGGNSIRTLVIPTPGIGNWCPVPPVPPQMVNVLPVTNTWRYLTNGNLDGLNWQAADFDDSSWRQGLPLMGNGAPQGETIRTPFATIPGQMTYYFRSAFTFPSNLSANSLQFSNIIDDGAVFYINGREVARLRLPPGPIVWSTPGVNYSGTPPWEGPLTIAVTNVQPGLNTIAVEVHQRDTGGGDILFGTRLDAIFVTNNPVSAGVTINEILASNSSYTNADGSTPDLVEFYNPSSNAVDLVGMSLTDDTLNPRRWVLPLGTVVPARGYTVLQFDADRLSSPTNSGYGLNANGDRLYLLTAQTQVLDSIVFGMQIEDYSVGRAPDGGSNWVLTLPTLGSENATAPLGDFRQLKVNEWMPRPAGGDDWFEIYNPESLPVAIGNLHLSDAVENPTRHQIVALSFVGAATNAWKKINADNNPNAGANHVNFALNNATEDIVIADSNGGVIDSTTYSGPQLGVSEGRLPDGAPTKVRFPGTDSPGDRNYLPLADIVVNEVLTHTDLPFEDAIELHNLSGADVNVGGWWLSDSRRELRKYRIPTGTIIPARGFKVFYEADFNNTDAAAIPFALSSSDGDQVHVSAVLGNGVLSGYRSSADFGAAENGVSFGRYVNSVGLVDHPAMSRRTFGRDHAVTIQDFRSGTGLSNAYPKVGPIVISEIMYHPPDIDTNDNVIHEFVELHNPNASAVGLYDPVRPTNTWRLRDAVDFDFPSGVSIAPGGYLLVVSFDPATNTAARASFQAQYGANAALYGPYEGKLDNSDENVELYKPDPPNPGGKVPYVLVERVHYADTPPWPLSADGFGDSLQRVSMAAYANDPAAWTSAPPAPGPSGALDSDSDGMPNDWEIRYSFPINNASNANQDADGDGFTNLQEYRAGTHPRDATSYLRISYITAVPGARMIEFNASAGITYSIIYVPEVESGAWTKLIDIPAQSANQPVQVFDPAGDVRRFYRLVTPSVP